MSHLIVFFSQLLAIFCVGFQQLNVIHAQKKTATFFALIIGSLSYLVTSTIAVQAVKEKSVSMCLAYSVGGALGIYLSMTLHPRLRTWLEKRTSEGETKG